MSSSMPIVILVLQALIVVILVDAVSSWVVRSPDQFPRNVTSKLTEPLYAPIRSVVNPRQTGGLDLSPLIWIIGLQVLANVLQ